MNPANGKGSSPRPVDHKRFSENHDLIFESKSRTGLEKDWYLFAINPWYKFYVNPVTSQTKQVEYR